MQVRCVVTGITPEGKSVFASDERVDPVTIPLVPVEFHRLWGTDTPALPDDGAPRPAMPYFPAPGGFRFGLFTLPPDSVAAAIPPDFDLAAALEEMERKLPGMAAHMEPDNPGMHTTDTVDYGYVVSGRVLLELDDGAQVELGPGDTYVQNGTRHAWRNPFDSPCTIVIALVGVARG